MTNAQKRRAVHEARKAHKSAGNDDPLLLAHKNQKEYNLAEEFYEKVYLQHGYDILGDDALLNMAEINQFQYLNKEKAMEYYEEILINYPESIYVVKARDRFRFLRGDNIQ